VGGPPVKAAPPPPALPQLPPKPTWPERSLPSGLATSPRVAAPSPRNGLQSAQALAAQALAAQTHAQAGPAVVDPLELAPDLRAAALAGGNLTMAANEAITVLGSRLTEATMAVADAPIGKAGPLVALVKDLALAITALRAL